MLNESSIVDRIEILDNNIIQIRTTTTIYRDNVEISKSYHRQCLNPGDDLSNQDERVLNIANLLWNDKGV